MRAVRDGLNWFRCTLFATERLDQTRRCRRLDEPIDEHRESRDRIAAEYAAAKGAGNFDVAAVIAGEAVGLIHDIPPAAEIVDRIVTEADQILLGRRNSATALRA